MSKLIAKAPTMSSVELVEVINEMRAGEGKRALRHDHFMAKIETHPGIDAPKFRGVYLGGNGQERPCYYLPKFECELMVMSESRKVQTQVLKRLKVLEEGALALKVVRVDSSTAFRVMTDMVVEVREEIGKSCKPHHFSNEALMINEIAFGVRKPIDRETLSLDDLRKLTKLEVRNTVLIARGFEYAERKEMLKEYHARLQLELSEKPKLLTEKLA